MLFGGHLSCFGQFSFIEPFTYSDVNTHPAGVRVSWARKEGGSPREGGLFRFGNILHGMLNVEAVTGVEFFSLGGWV